MVNAILGQSYDMGTRLARIEATLLALSTQPILLNASTGQDGGQGVSTDAAGVHVYDPSGMEVVRLQTSDGSMQLFGEVGAIGFYSGKATGTTVPIIYFTTTDNGGVQSTGTQIYQSYNELVVRGPQTTTNAQSRSQLGLSDTAVTATAYGTNGNPSTTMTLGSDIQLNAYDSTGAGAASAQVHPNGSWSIGDWGYLAAIFATTTAGPVNVTGGLSVSGTKNFMMHHPTKPGWMLKHASTESPHNGVEYWGTATLDGNGTTVVDLPAYFDALTSPDNRSVQLTQQGRATVPMGYDPIVGNQFTAYGTPGATFSWLVKAVRESLPTDAPIGFEVESEGYPEMPTPTAPPAPAAV